MSSSGLGSALTMGNKYLDKETALREIYTCQTRRQLRISLRYVFNEISSDDPASHPSMEQSYHPDPEVDQPWGGRIVPGPHSVSPDLVVVNTSKTG